MKLEKHSVKAQEKFADHLMSVATSIITATFIGVLVVPLSAFVNAFIVPNQQPLSFLGIFSRMSWGSIVTFGVLYAIPLLMAEFARSHALRIYDRVSKELKKPNITVSQTLRDKAVQRRCIQKFLNVRFRQRTFPFGSFSGRGLNSDTDTRR